MEKALIFGAHSPRNLLKRKMTLDASVLARKFGIELEYVAISELIEQYDEIGDRRVGQLGTVQEAADELVGGALPRDLSEAPPRTEVENAVRLYLAMSEIIEQRSAAAAAIVCAPFIQSPEHPTPCIALGLLQDRGIPAACQGDLEALVTMMVLHKIAGKPSYMGNVFRDNRTVVLSHCVMARKLLGYNAKALPYYLCDYHGKKAGLTIRADVPKGRVVTLCRFTMNLKSLVAGRGKVVDSYETEDSCRNAVCIEIEDIDTLMKLRLDHQYHFVFATGDHIEALRKLTDKAGIELISV